MLAEAAVAIGRWTEENQDLLHAVGVWGSVAEACEQAHLYAPVDGQSWQAIASANRTEPLSAQASEDLILGLYAPGGPGYPQLRRELLEAPLLSDWRTPTQEVLDALDREHFYLSICGALPLVESCLAEAAGRWQNPKDYDLESRLFSEQPASVDDEAEMLLNVSAIDMLRHGIPEIWEGGAAIGADVPELRRNVVAHGLGKGWNTNENATRAVLLVAAAARVAGPLLRPIVTSSLATSA